MSEKKYCYRYVDTNDHMGRAAVSLWRMVVLHETERTFWYCHDMPQMSIEQMQQCRSAPRDRNVRRCLKGAARSRYHLTKEEALKAFVYRKTFQLNRIRLTAETVDLCLRALSKAGHITGITLDDGLQINRSCDVLSVPRRDVLACETAGPVASTFSWGEW